MKLIKLLLAALFFTISSVWAGDLEDGNTAWKAGDYSKALEKYKMASAQGNADAPYHVGSMYSEGMGILQDKAEAVKWFRLAASRGNTNSQNNLASMYYFGNGAIQDYVKAYMWANIASIKGKYFSALRDLIANSMTPQQIAESQKLARECLARNFKSCD